MRNLAFFLRKNGISSEIITLCDTEKWKFSSNLDKRSVDHVNVLVWPCYNLSRLATALSITLETHFLPSNPTHLKKHLQAFDVLHFHDDVDLSFPLACLEMKKPRVFTFHSLPFRLKYYLRNPLARKLLIRSTNLFHVFSNGDKERLTRLGANTEQIRIVPTGVDIGSFRPRDQDIPRDFVSLVWVGRIERRKGLKTLLEALYALKKNRLTKTPVKVTMVGKVWDDQYYRELVDYKAKMQLSEVTFVGFVEDLPSFLQQADVFVYPSLQETFPIANLEAMASGLPIVATSVGGIPEAVIGNETGFLVPPNDPKCLAQKLSLLVNNDQLRKNMGNRGRKRAETMFSIEKMTTTMSKIYCELT